MSRKKVPIHRRSRLAICAAAAAAGITFSAPSALAATAAVHAKSAFSVTAGINLSQRIGEVGASRLLTQGSFGASPATISSTAQQTYRNWFNAQYRATKSLNLPAVRAAANAGQSTNWIPVWFSNVIHGNDQLRQRMAFALSEILVVSNNGGPLIYQNEAAAAYYDLLVNDALDNYRTLLDDISRSPAMGLWLSFFRNNKPDTASGVHADENYAREIMQLFSIGLVQLNADGTTTLDANGHSLPTYNQDTVTQMANVFTGWASQADTHSGEDAWIYDYDLVDPMACYTNHHDTSVKTIVNGVQVSAGGSCADDLATALDALFNHPNVGPFIGKQLIQRLVTSNPSPAYVQRVAAVFDDNGSGVRGDLFAVAKAILTDPEAVAPTGDGKLREPLLRQTAMWRAFDAVDGNGGYHEYQVVNETYGTYAEGPLQSPSVFNFFRPDYQRAGTLSAAGLYVPEFQITNEYTQITLDNYLRRYAYQYVDSHGAVHAGADYDESGNIGADNVLLHTSAWESYAASTSNLVNELNLVFMSNQMPAGMQNALSSYIDAIPASDTASRVIEASALLLTSPQYAIQR